MGMEKMGGALSRGQFEDIEKQKQAAIDTAHEEALGINAKINEAEKTARELKGEGGVEEKMVGITQEAADKVAEGDSPVEKMKTGQETQGQEKQKETPVAEKVGSEQETKEKFEEAKMAAEMMLRALEVKIQEKSVQIREVKEEWFDKKIGSIGDLLKNMGITYPIGKLLENRLNKKYKEKLSKIEDEREALYLEKIKIIDPDEYNLRVFNKKIKEGNVKLDEIFKYNKNSKVGYKIPGYGEY